jgi:hypothetical protein
MLTSTGIAMRRRSPWRELLHPLPVRARQYQWWRRDMCEVNEAMLRTPFYTLKPMAAAAVEAQRAGLRAPAAAGPQLPEDTIPRDVLLRPAAAESWDTIAAQQVSKR